MALIGIKDRPIGCAQLALISRLAALITRWKCELEVDLRASSSHGCSHAVWVSVVPCARTWVYPATPGVGNLFGWPLAQAMQTHGL